MKKITLSEFFKNDEKLAIHCDTEEKANLLLKAFDKMGKRWRSNQSYLEENKWRGFKEKTCYENDGTYCCKEFYLGTSYIVYEFEEVILEDGNYMNNNVKKVFEMLGVKPNEKFNVMSKGKVDSEVLRIDTRLRVLTDTSNIVAEALRYLLTGEWQIVKLQPKKKKLRDWTMEDFKKWEDVNCKGVCDDCPFTNVHCNDNAKRFWMNHKDLFSDKFLDQEVEVPE